jgi:hypothetical protein
MNLEKNALNKTEKQPIEPKKEAGGLESSEVIEREMIKKAESDLAGFEKSSDIELKSAEKKAAEDGLEIDPEDKNKLAELNQKAEGAKAELEKEISNEIQPDIAKIKSCQNCGKENNLKNNFCEECGKEFEKIKTEEVDQEEVAEAELSKEEVDKIKEMAKSCDNLEFEGNLFEKINLCESFIKSNLEKKGYFSALLKNSETSGFTLEAMRYFLVTDRLEDCLKEKDKKVQDLLLLEVLSSLDNIEEQLSNMNAENAVDDSRLANRFKNNAFYVVSEMLNENDSSDQKKICQWLNKHFENIVDPELSKIDSRKNADIISQFTLSNIVGRSLDSNLVKKSLDKLLDKRKALNNILDKVFRNESDEGKKEMVAEFFADKLGLDNKVVGKWKEARTATGEKDKDGKEIYIGNYEENIISGMELEEMKPGSTKLLFEKFGIANFSRYYQEDLIHQIEAAEENKPYGIVAFPEADWNGAFDTFNIRESLNNMAEKLQEKGFEMRIIEVSSQFELAKRLNGFDKKYGQDGNKIGFLIIAGHGTQDSVKLGNFEHELVPPPIQNPEMTDQYYQEALKKWQISQTDNLRNVIVSEDIQGDSGRGIKRAADKWFEKKAPVVFLSCSTGKEGGIAQSTASQLGFETIGPEKDASVDLINVNFNEKGKPFFNVKYSSILGDVETMRYKKETV